MGAEDRPAGVVQIWQVALTLEVEPHQDWLTAEERARAARFLFDKDRRQFVRARNALRAILGAARGEDPADVALLLEPRGKPYVAGGPHFSLSHAGGHALIAVADGPVGVDIEVMRAPAELPGMAAMIMAPAEKAAWDALPADARVRAFYRAWTRKEALLKARGDGLLAEPRGVDVGVEPGRERVVSVDGVAWRLHDLRPGGELLAAVACDAPFGVELLTLNTPLPGA